MPLSSPADKQIDRYTGPYERWVFTEELGRPYAFPAIARGPSHYHTALLKGSSTPPSGAGMTSRLPPLWNPLGNTRSTTPFCFHVLTPSANDTDIDVAEALAPPPGQSTPRYRVNFPIADKAWVQSYQPCCDMTHWVVPDTKPKAIVAVIDDGIPFAHRAFLDSNNRTRISHCWLQSARADKTASVPFGRELMNGDINALRTRCGEDEPRMYREAQADDARLEEVGTNIRRHGTHGSHVLGVAAGNDAMFKTCPQGDDVQIIAVQLPNTIAWDTSGFGKEMYMLSALNYIFDRAREIAAKYSDDPANPDELPLIVNFSYGWSASRHDGGSEMDLAMEELLQDRKSLQPKTALVLPSGNNFGNKMHGQITADDMCKGAYSFGWKLLPDDRTSSYIELWFPEGMVVNDYTVTIAPPKGTDFGTGAEIKLAADPTLPPGGDPRRFINLEADGKIIGQASVDKNNGQRWRAMFAIVPTVYTRNQPRRAPVGTWEITVKRNSGKPMSMGERINIWVQRDDDPALLNTGGQQSELVDLSPPDKTRAPKHPLRQYDPHLDFIRGYGCQNGISTANSITRVSGYVASTQRPSLYSGGGGLHVLPKNKAAPWGAQPTIAAVADQGPMRTGTPSIGVISGSNTRLIGTSGAAPSVARLMVNNAAAGRDLMHGMGQMPPVHPVELSKNPIVQTMHKARMGPHIAPPISP